MEFQCFVVVKDSFCVLQYWAINLCIFKNWESNPIHIRALVKSFLLATSLHMNFRGCLNEGCSSLGGCLFVCSISCVKMFSLSVCILGCLPD